MYDHESSLSMWENSWLIKILICGGWTFSTKIDYNVKLFSWCLANYYKWKRNYLRYCCDLVLVKSVNCMLIGKVRMCSIGMRLYSHNWEKQSKDKYQSSNWADKIVMPIITIYDSMLQVIAIINELLVIHFQKCWCKSYDF